MDRQQVESSNIASIGHDAETNVLEIEFKNGAVYQYPDVPRWRYNEMMSADSKGQFLHSDIIPNHQGYRVPG